MRKNFTLLFCLGIALFISSGSYGQWNRLSSPAQYYGAFYLESHGGKLYAAGNAGVYSSSDNGQSWTDLTQGFAASSSTSNRELAFIGSNIYVRTTTESVFKSTDNGLTWQYDSVGLGAGKEIKAIFTDGTKVFAYEQYPAYGLFSKLPSDPSWTRISSNNIGVSNVVSGMVKIGSSIYAATSSDFYESTDGGSTFTKKVSTTYPGGCQFSTYAGATLIVKGNDMYYTCGGIYKTSDGGSTWARVDQGFPKYFGGVWVCALHTDGSKIYAGVSQTDSAFVSSDNGATWSSISDGNLTGYLTSFAVHNNKLFATQFGKDSILVYSGGGAGIKSSGTFTENSLRFSPNPAGNFTRIISDNVDMQTEILISDLQGREIDRIVNPKSNTGSANSVLINTSNYPKGMYFVRMNTKKGSYTGKLLIMEP